MDTDLFLAGGLLLLVVALPSMLSAWADSRVPQIGLLLLVCGAGLVGFALLANPEGYRLGDVPTVLLEVFARLVN